jgi:mRNA interferase RelE/StbE
MKYKIEFKASVEKDLKKLDCAYLANIYRKISYLEDFPGKGDIKKLANTDGFFRLRVGEYRVIFRVEGKVITVFYIRHRKDVYKNC